MLMFKKLSWKNFLSTGNVTNSIDLNTHSSTLITGKNGEGKSTMLCALTFVLFGKPFRNVNKNQLVNSINKKNCLVEIEFSVNGHDYVVKRGIKPVVFEIHCDGKLINQDAALRDYQKVLEQQILKLNYKTFTQVVILGSATFVPFMQLPALQRREVIEDILDIKVFSIMNTILKDKIAQVKDEISNIDNEINNHKSKINSQKKLIEVIESNRKSFIESIEAKLNANNDTINKTYIEMQKVTEEMEHLRVKESKYSETHSAIEKASRMKVKITTNIDTCKHDIEFFDKNTSCPSCAQTIADEHKNKILLELESKITEHTNKLNDVEQAVVKLNKQLDSLNEVLDALRTKSIELSTLRNTAKILTDQNADLVKEMQDANNNVNDITGEKLKMRQYAEQAIELVTAKSDLLDQRQLHDVAMLLLKDTGIKTAIIREYLPVINKLINKYLAAMDFFVKFELDDSFQEIIKSRGRDQFTYASFSEGEKRRLDLAILFTWRQIARMKNSVNTNLLILDEILDGSLDGTGIDYFLSIMNQFGEHTNVFVISHKVHQMIERFDHVVRVEKKNDFSVMTQGG